MSDGVEIVSVEVNPQVVDWINEKKKRKQERMERVRNDILDEAAMLTDEQIERAVFCISPNDEEHLDVARFFLQELSRRDSERALEVFRRWRDGA